MLICLFVKWYEFYAKINRCWRSFWFLFPTYFFTLYGLLKLRWNFTNKCSLTIVYVLTAVIKSDGSVLTIGNHVFVLPSDNELAVEFVRELINDPPAKFTAAMSEIILIFYSIFMTVKIFSTTDDKTLGK